ncbi:MAG TPA: RluA family pseudouridine synthase [Burkholderiales bacterium]|nr:RluA family pseudouridine synthase [Burkholderiales bacterium]
MKGLSKDSATWHEVGEEGDAQRVDNYLTRLMKGVPKSHIYRILRSGEVRVNSGRVGPAHRLKIGDRLRVPPVRTAERSAVAPQPRKVTPRLADRVIHEDEALLVIDKPAGMAVHGGSGVSVGVIEQLRLERPEARFLELVHRLDRETSGVLVIAKKRSALTHLHAQLREGRAHKYYLALAKGVWAQGRRSVKVPLHKYVLANGERRVSVHADGQAAHTIFRMQRLLPGWSLVEAELKTGRTHQIRVHLAHLGSPIAGDDKYGDFELNKALAKTGLKRMFLHACRLTVSHPLTESPVTFESPLPSELSRFLDTQSQSDAPAI